jgi:hypothetical protein
MTPRELAPIAALALAIGGCGDAPAANAPEAASRDHFSVRTQDGGALSVLVTPSAADGERVSFGRFREHDGDFVRGSAFGKPVFLTVEQHRAFGLLGAQPFDLHVEPAGDALHFTGLVGGKPSDFWFSPRALHGKVGTCGYELQRKGDAYEGSTGCVASPRFISVEVPNTLARWSPPELGAVLAIFLSNPPS